MKYFTIKIFLCLIMAFPQAIYAQNSYYRPDTTLNFDSFVQQCLNFKAANRQEVWIVHFWASWDNKSLNNLPDLKYVQSQFKDYPIKFFSISEDKQRYKWESALMLYKMDWKHLMISKSTDLDYLKRAFPYKSLPAIFFVNSTGMIRRIYDIPALNENLNRAAANLPQVPFSGVSPVSSNEDQSYDNDPSPNVNPVSNPSESAYDSPNPNRLPSSDPPVQAEPVSNTSPLPQNDPPVSNPPVEEPAPVQPQPNANPGESEWLIHIVEKGETLYRLYVKYSVPVEEIRRLNGLPNNNIKAGQRLKIKKN